MQLGAMKSMSFKGHLQASDALKNLLDGLSVRISHVNQVTASADCIDIAWNFEV